MRVRAIVGTAVVAVVAGCGGAPITHEGPTGASTDRFSPLETSAPTDTVNDESVEWMGRTHHLPPETVADLLALLGEGNQYASILVRGNHRLPYTVWTSEDLSDADRSALEAEIGVPAHELRAISVGLDQVIVAAIETDRATALERVLDASPWADLAERQTV